MNTGQFKTVLRDQFWWMRNRQQGERPAFTIAEIEAAIEGMLA